MPTAQTQYDFRSKYTQGNFLTRWMLGRYFGSLERLVLPLELSTAVEVGCGEGFSTARIRKMLPPAAALEACDVEDRLVQAAIAANPDVPIRRESIYDLQRPDASSDLVFVLEVLEHLEDPAKAMVEVCRVSRRWIIASVPNEPIWRMMNMARLKYLPHMGNTPGHIKHWSGGEFVRFVQSFAKVKAVLKPLPWTMVLAEVGRP